MKPRYRVIFPIIIVLILYLSLSNLNYLMNRSMVLSNMVKNREGGMIKDSDNAFGDVNKVSIYDPYIRLKTANTDTWNYAKHINISVGWVYGPGNETIKVDARGRYITLGTNLGIILYDVNGTRINGYYLGINVTFIKLMDVDNDAKPEVLAGTFNGSALCYRLNGELLFHEDAGSQVITMNYTDFYTDLEKDFIVVTSTSALIYGKNGSLLGNQSIPGEIRDAVIGDIDNDGLSEVIIGSKTGTIYVIDNQGIQYTCSLGNEITSLFTYDINGDGFEEILVGLADGELALLTYNGKIMKLVKITSNPIRWIEAGDLNGDGEINVATLDSLGLVTILNSTLDNLWQYNFSQPAIKLIPAQVNLGMPQELLIVLNKSLICIAFNSSSNLWDIVWNHRSTFSIMDANADDLDLDGISEILFGGNNYALFILENNSGIRNIIVYTLYGDKLSVSDIDSDGLPEKVVTDSLGNVFLIKEDDLILWNKSIGVEARNILLGDLDSDGDDEIVLILRNNSIIVLFANGTISFKHSPSSVINDAIIADGDDDGSSEILIATTNGLVIVNSSGLVERTLLANNNVTTVCVGDLYNLKHESIIMGLHNGSIIVYDLPTGKITTLGFTYGAITDVLSGFFGQSDEEHLVFSTNNGYMAMINLSTVLWEIKSNYPITSILNLPENSQLVANYTYGFITTSYSGSIIFNYTMEKGIKSISFGDVIGNGTDTLTILGKNGELYFFSNAVRLISDIVFSETSPSMLYNFDMDLDDVSETLLLTRNGLLQIDTPPIITITEPANNTITNSSKVIVKWIYQGFSPLFYEIYLNSEIAGEINTPNQSCEITIPSDGKWNILLKAIPSNGRTLEAEIVILLDTQPPSLSIIGPSNNSYVSNNSITVSWSGFDELSGIDHFDVRLNNETWINVGLNKSYTFSNLDYGVQVISIRAIDKAININESKLIIYIDYIAPEIHVLYPVNNSYINQSHLNVLWSYNEDNLDYFELYLDGELLYKGTNNNYTISNLTDGNHSITVICMDLAGNNASQRLFVVIDTKIPDLEIISPDNCTYLNKKTVIIKVNYSDDNFDALLISVNNSAPILYENQNEIELSVNSEGYYLITVIAKDKASNCNITHLVIIVDLTKPDLIITYPNNNTFVNTSTITVKWLSFDNLSGIKTYEVMIDNQANIRIGKQTNYTFTDLSNGCHNITIRAIDNAGNIAYRTIVVWIDTIPPNISIVNPNKTYITNSSTITITIRYQEENLGALMLYINDSLISKINSTSFVIHLRSEGYYIIKVKAIDLAGNSDEASIAVIFDATPPVLTLPAQFNNTVLQNNSMKITWMGYDELSGVAYYMVSLDNESYVNIGLKQYYVIDLTELSYGKHEFKIKAVDLAGNVVIKRIYFFKETKRITPKGLPITLIVSSIAVISIIALIDAYILIFKKNTKA